MEVSPETNRARCATCGRELALTNTRNDALSRIDAGQINDGISPPRPHSSPADQLAVSEGSKTDPLLKTIQGSSAGISAQISNSVTDARLLLERWTRENLLDPQEKPSSRSSEKSSTSDISQSSTSASETSTTKREQPRSTLLPDPSQPDVITRVITESSKTGRPPQPHNELPPPPPREEKPKKDDSKTASNDEGTKTVAESSSVPRPKFAERYRNRENEPVVSEPVPKDKPTADTLSRPELSSTVESKTQIDNPRQNHLTDDESVNDEPPVVENTAKESATATTKSKFRFDVAHPNPGDQSLLDQAFSTPIDEVREREPMAKPRSNFDLPRSESNVARQVHAPHSHLAGVHFDVQSMIRANDEKTSQSTQSILGQILAYLGVGVLTLGAGCVLWGYFGAAQYSHLAPTGWLITTAGQMLLFLGVVTLIAGGLEQTNSIVNARLEHWERKWMEFNGHTYRVDPPTMQPMGQGPHLPVEAFHDSRTIPESSNASGSRI
ncbi:MAG: hypothetical protein O2955_03765 [Planctomycetota bacterium]|nr:hypothetical protein [Planctomycetota bacterium]MDA1211605.1 hypothetical protein [Planctomycetota bacterium]